MLPQNHTPGTPASGAGTASLGVHGSTGSGSSSPSSISGTHSMPSPLVALVSATQASRVARSTNRLARKPGIEPVCPVRRRPAASISRRPEPVPRGRRPRRRHLGQGRRCQDVGVTGGQEVGPPEQVGDRAPGLAGRRHRDGVLVGLVGELAGEVHDAVALRVRRHREVRRARHAQRLQQLRGDHVPPRGAPQPRHRLAEERVAEVAVVVVLPRAGHPAGAVVGGEQRVHGHAG